MANLFSVFSAESFFGIAIGTGFWRIVEKNPETKKYILTRALIGAILGGIIGILNDPVTFSEIIFCSFIGLSLGALIVSNVWAAIVGAFVVLIIGLCFFVLAIWLGQVEPNTFNFLGLFIIASNGALCGIYWKESRRKTDSQMEI